MHIREWVLMLRKVPFACRLQDVDVDVWWVCIKGRVRVVCRWLHLERCDLSSSTLPREEEEPLGTSYAAAEIVKKTICWLEWSHTREPLNV